MVACQRRKIRVVLQMWSISWLHVHHTGCGSIQSRAIWDWFPANVAYTFWVRWVLYMFEYVLHTKTWSCDLWIFWMNDLYFTSYLSTLSFSGDADSNFNISSTCRQVATIKITSTEVTTEITKGATKIFLNETLGSLGLLDHSWFFLLKKSSVQTIPDLIQNIKRIP